MNFLLEIGKSDYTQQIIKTKGFAETLWFGLQMVFIGMATVFSVLILLWISLILFKFAFAKTGKKPPKEKPLPSPVPSAPVYTPAYSESDEIVAVIAAAIAMAEAESGGAKFRVVSFKRK